MTAPRTHSLQEPTEFLFGDIVVSEQSGEVSLYYGYNNGLTFCEIVNFGAPLPSRNSPLREDFDAAILSLHVAAGISYYKAYVADKITFAKYSLSENQLRFFQKLYRGGLGEFGFRNKIDLEARVNFLDRRHDPTIGVPNQKSDKPEVHSSVSRSGIDVESLQGRGDLPRRSAVLLGGGKDSLVSVEVLRASSEPMVLFSVNPKKPILDCASVSDLPFVSVSRVLDPNLFELNAAGAYNGHVPITAIVSLIAIAGAFVHGYDAVILSNERSADEGNLMHNGAEVNHQYSKTSEFERDLRSYVAEHISKRVSYLSLLRPLSELHIAQLMARTARYDDCFTSCNRAFQIRPTETPARWCCDCPKCRFTFLALATAMAPDRVVRIFGRNLLDDPSQLPGYEELVGLFANKPWECVGEIAESASAINYLASKEEWRKCFVVTRLSSRLTELIDQAGDMWRDLFTPHSDHSMPQHFERALNAYIRRR